MDSDLQWQIDHLEQQFREIEPRAGIHPEARELCAEALAWHLPQLRELSLAESSQNTTVALLEAWHIYLVVRSRIAESEKTQQLIDEALSRALKTHAA
jgi:hypothetical protein